MALFDMPLDKLKTYKPANTEPADFDAFWKRTLAQAAKFPLDATYTRLDDAAYKLVDAYDVTFRGFGGQPVKGWFIEPAGNTRRLPALVKFLGYGGGRGFALDHLSTVAAGFSALVMDTRGQGSGWSPGHTPDDAGSGPQVAGCMTRGIDSPDTYYYRRVFTDAARAVHAMAAHPRIDPRRIGVEGGSQGGGISIAAAALCPKLVKVVLADVPFLCHYPRATTLVNSMPYAEITQYLKCHRGRSEQVYKTLAYFDGVNLARRIKGRCLFSVGLMDETCPPSTVYAAYNQIKAPKEMCIYDFNNHEGGGSFQTAEKLRFAAKWL